MKSNIYKNFGGGGKKLTRKNRKYLMKLYKKNRTRKHRGGGKPGPAGTVCWDRIYWHDLNLICVEAIKQLREKNVEAAEKLEEMKVNQMAKDDRGANINLVRQLKLLTKTIGNNGYEITLSEDDQKFLNQFCTDTACCVISGGGKELPTFESTKTKLKEILEKVEPDKEYQELSQTILQNIDSLKEETFNKFIDFLYKKFKDEFNKSKKQKGGARDEQDLTCSVCLNPLVSGSEISDVLYCSVCQVDDRGRRRGPGFHRECLEDWGNQCPLCRGINTFLNRNNRPIRLGNENPARFAPNPAPQINHFALLWAEEMERDRQRQIEYDERVRRSMLRDNRSYIRRITLSIWLCAFFSACYLQVLEPGSIPYHNEIYIAMITFILGSLGLPHSIKFEIINFFAHLMENHRGAIIRDLFFQSLAGGKKTRRKRYKRKRRTKRKMRKKRGGAGWSIKGKTLNNPNRIFNALVIGDRIETNWDGVLYYGTLIQKTEGKGRTYHKLKINWDKTGFEMFELNPANIKKYKFTVSSQFAEIPALRQQSYDDEKMAALEQQQVDTTGAPQYTQVPEGYESPPQISKRGRKPRHFLIPKTKNPKSKDIKEAAQEMIDNLKAQV